MSCLTRSRLRFQQPRQLNHIASHDSQYSEDEYRDRVGWGHSSVDQAVGFARIAKARRLVMFHHDPNRRDEDLELLLTQAVDVWGDEGEPPLLAHEGLEVDFSRDEKRGQ